MASLLNLPEIPDCRYISLAQNQSSPSVPFQKRTLFERSTTLRDDCCCSHAYMLLRYEHTHFLPQYWSGQNRTRRTACAGPVLQGIPKVIVYTDDIFVAGRDETEHLSVLNQVLQRLEQSGLHLKKEKCNFMVLSVTYLGYRIDAEGLHPVEEKVKAVQAAPEPQNTSELKSYLGQLSYYSRFLPQMASTLSPLYNLLRKKGAVVLE